MNIYELVQKSIQEIEMNLEDKIHIDQLANHIGMSESNLYRFFLSLVGYSIKEYIRLRRVSEAALLLRLGKTVTEVTFLFDYQSLDAFTRAFKKITGYLPSHYKKLNVTFVFEPVDLIRRHFMIQKKSPFNVKIVKALPPYEVVCFDYLGFSPEDGAFALFRTWLKESKIDLAKEGLRIFGYNHPNPTDDSNFYGYRVCVTLKETIKPLIKNHYIDHLAGGRYALMTVKQTNDKPIGESIMEAWQRFSQWLEQSKYQLSHRQWLEEHHGFDSDYFHIGSVDLYMSIEKKPTVLTK